MPEELAQPLALIALIGATIEYATMIRRRKQRARERAADDAAEAGLRGLIRVLVVDH